MHHHHYPMPHYPYPPQAGLIGIAGGVINLATSALYGGVRAVRTIVERSVWGTEYPPPHGMWGYGHAACGHVCHVHCVPETYECCGCCC
jgi:hypothetical protein